jgi:hypothetical protein
VGLTLRVQEKVSIENCDLIFVGYGIVAPEYEWNDYEGIDANGKNTSGKDTISLRMSSMTPGT